MLAAPYGWQRFWWPVQHTLLFTVINQDVTGRSNLQMNLAAIRDFNAQFAVLDNASHDASKLWEAGWWRIQSPGQRFAHYGTGQLTMAATGGSGTIDASLAEVDDRHHGALTIHGSWSCRHLQHAS